MGLLEVGRIPFCFITSCTLRHRLPPPIDSLTAGRLPHRAAVLALGWRKRSGFAFLLEDAGVEESLRIEDGTVDLHTLASFLDA